MEMPKPRHDFPLSLNSLVASLAEIVFGELIRAVLGDLSPVHARHVHRLPVRKAVLGSANRLAAVRAHHAAVVELLHRSITLLQPVAVLSLLQRGFTTVAQFDLVDEHLFGLCAGLMCGLAIKVDVQVIREVFFADTADEALHVELFAKCFHVVTVAHRLSTPTARSIRHRCFFFCIGVVFLIARRARSLQYEYDLREEHCL